MPQVLVENIFKKRKQKQALNYFYEGYHAQMKKKYAKAIEMYQASLRLYPTPEAYTFLGWTYSFLGELDAAIEECRHAIALDPDFGNPYNDIGAYLIAKGTYTDAIPYLKKALSSKRYRANHFAYYNLGRVYEHQGNYLNAYRFYKHALQAEPRYLLAQHAMGRIREAVLLKF